MADGRLEVTWESQHDGEWTEMGFGKPETIRFIDGRYLGFKDGGAPRRVVRVDDVDWKLDFSRMTMKSGIDGHIYPIRRRELPALAPVAEESDLVAPAPVAAAPAPAPGAPGDPLRALSVHYLSGTFLKELREAELTLEATIRDIEPVVVRSAGEKKLCPRDGRLGAAYVDVVTGDDDVGHATHMLSYTWGYQIGMVVDSLVAWCKKRDLDPKSVYVWMCVFCINQHRVLESSAAGKIVPFEDFRKEFESRVCGVGRVLALLGSWQTSLYTTRVWCVFELYTAKRLMDEGRAGFALEVLLSPAEAEEFRSILIDGEGFEPIWKALSGIKVEKAQSFSAVDRERILSLVRDGPGYGKLNKEIIDHLHCWFAENSDGYLRERLAAKVCDLPTARACSRVGAMLVHTSKFKDALMLVRQGKTILESLDAMESDHAAILLRVEGNVLRRLGDLEDARSSYKLARQIHEKKAARNPSELSNLLQDIGRLEGDFCNLDSELKCHQEACQIRSEAGILNTPEGATLMRSLGMVYFQKYNYTSALEFFRKAEAMHKATNSLQTPEGAAALESIGNVISSMHPPQWKDALTMHEEAHRISNELGIGDSPKGIAQLRRVAHLHDRLGFKEKAAEMLAQAKAICTKLKEVGKVQVKAAAKAIPAKLKKLAAPESGSDNVLPWAEEDADWGVYYELVQDKPHADPKSRGFPFGLCSFETKAVEGIPPEHLLMSWDSLEEMTTKGREWTLHRAAITGSRHLSGIAGPGEEISITGYFSPLHAVNISDETKEKIGIPTAAKYFMFSYPVHVQVGAIVKEISGADDPDMAFLVNGGYVYLDADKSKIIHMNAILPSAAGGLMFGPPLKWEPKWTNRLIHAGRFRPVTVDAIKAGGATYFCWVRPHEVIWFGQDAGGGAPICPFGGFAYIRREAAGGARNGPSLKRLRNNASDAESSKFRKSVSARY